MTLLWVLVGIAVLGGVAVVAAGRGEGLPPAEPDRPDVVVPLEHLLVKDDVDRLRFSVGLRGYRMDEVDDVLDRLAADIAARDALIDRLERQLADAASSVVAPAEPPAAGGPANDAAQPAEATSADSAEATSRTMIVPVHELRPGEVPPTGEPDGG